MKTKIIILIVVFFMSQDIVCQSKNNLKDIYPIGENPNFGYKTSMVNSIEKIVFEANPILRTAIYNNFNERLSDTLNNKFAHAWYLAFRPQLRMYDDNSKPVKSPTYKISILGFQYMKILNKNRFLTFSIESGHYSNGQSGCAFGENIEDGSIECENIFNSIDSNTNLTSLLNRKNGNFSTNFTEIIVNYRLITKIENNLPKKTVSIKAGLNRYHNNLLFLADVGGYTENDINIYGKNRFIGSVEHILMFNENSKIINCLKINRFSNSLSFEFIDKPHPFINPWRLEYTSTIFFKNNTGVFISGIYGHDNYNYRFVDQGLQLYAGLTFDVFPPIEIKPKQF